MMRCCFDKRVWAGLGVLAAVLLLADPRRGWAALPVLAGLACPVSMLFMMRGRGRNPAAAQPLPQDQQDQQAQEARAAEIARLRREIEQLKAHTRR